jgi:hypothetical protein
MIAPRRRDHEVRFFADPAALKAAWWVMSAKQADTRQRRFARLIEASLAGRRLD